MAFLNDPDATGIQAGSGWAWNASSNAFYKSAPLGDSHYEVCIYTNSGATGTVLVAVGYVPAPLVIGSGVNQLAAAGVSAAAPTPSYLARAIRAELYKRPPFPKGMAVKNTIDFNGNTVTVDSFDNELGPYGSVGASGLNIRDKAEVATDADLYGGTLGNAKIKGHLHTGPAAKVGIGPNGSVGNSAWVDTGTKGIQSGCLRMDSNFSLPDVQPPWSSAQPAPPTGALKYELGSATYQITGPCTIDKNNQMLVTGDAKLWIKGDLNLAEFVTVTNSGARLTLYVSGNISFSGVWDSIDPEDILIYGLPSCKSVDVPSGAKIKCALYAPSANVSVAGTAMMFGSMAANAIKMNGSTSFHCDESLGRHVPLSIYKVISWREL